MEVLTHLATYVWTEIVYRIIENDSMILYTITPEIKMLNTKINFKGTVMLVMLDIPFSIFPKTPF